MRRRRANRDAGDYDSVLDTMTNVVGILIIVVAVTQLNVSSAVGRARTAMVASGEAIDHPPVSEQVLEVARRTREETKSRLDKLAAAAGGSGSGEGVSEAEWEELKRKLQGSLPPETAPKLEREIRRLKTRIKELREELGHLKEQKKRILVLIEKLRAELHALKKKGTRRPPAISVRLPDPSSKRVEGMTMRQYLVRRGKVYVWDVASVEKRWERDRVGDERAMPAAVALTLRSRLEWLAERWNRRGYANGTLRLRFRVVRDSSVPGGWDLRRIDELVPGATGYSLATIQRANSSFQRALRRLAVRGDWLHFYVFDDSFETYIAARAVAEDLGLNVGWRVLSREGRIEWTFGGKGSGREPESD